MNGLRRATPKGFVVALTLMTLFICSCSPSDQESEAEDNERKIPVETVLVEGGAIRREVEAIGTLEALEAVEIKTEIDGIIEKIHFTGGDTVEKEELLASLDDDKLKRELNAQRAALEAAKAQLKMARLTFERHQKLVRRGSVSLEQFDKARTDLRSSTAEVDRIESEIALIKERLEDASIRAPFEGVVSENRVDPGDYVAKGDPLTTVYRTSPIEVQFPVPERYMGEVRTGLAVEVSVPAHPDEVFSGAVSYVSPSVEEDTRTLAVKARIDNDEGLLKPGGFGRTILVLEERTGKPLIPEEALVGAAGGYIVFVVENGVARRREVQVGLREPGAAEILKGLHIGEKLVRKGHMRLRDGAPVRIVGRQQGPPDAARSEAKNPS